MGIFLNPGNSGFARILGGEYIDKTGIIEVVNKTLNGPEMLTSISRPRRFGKSYAAQTLCAYYDCSCDSHELFDGLEISKSPDYEKYINKFNVIYVDIAGTKPYTDNFTRIVPFLTENLYAETVSEYPWAAGDFLTGVLSAVAEKTEKKFIVIIDEWDSPIRENPSITKEYLHFLRSLFKNSGTTAKIFAAAYMTGILPIKKDGSQSALSDFNEYTILDPLDFTEYTGFTEAEVKSLCDKYGMDFEEAKKWYNGYSFPRCDSVYNPYSVMKAMQTGSFESYWIQTSAAEALITYINMDFGGLQEDILRLIAGEEIPVNTRGFRNDFISFGSKNEVLTLLIHLGYLAYNKAEKTVRIPNDEIRCEFDDIIERADHTSLAGLVKTSEKLLKDTLNGNEAEVVKAIEAVRDSEYAPAFYNDEQALRYVIKFAYIVCVDKYMKIEELPSGRGIADVVFIPKKKTADPAIIVELKWNRSSEAAIAQIKEKNYPAVLKDYSGKILLVGLNYDEDKKQHTCKIETVKTEECTNAQIS